MGSDPTNVPGEFRDFGDPTLGEYLEQGPGTFGAAGGPWGSDPDRWDDLMQTQGTHEWEGEMASWPQNFGTGLTGQQSLGDLLSYSYGPNEATPWPVSGPFATGASGFFNPGAVPLGPVGPHAGSQIPGQNLWDVPYQGGPVGQGGRAGTLQLTPGQTSYLSPNYPMYQAPTFYNDPGMGGK